MAAAVLVNGVALVSVPCWGKAINTDVFNRDVNIEWRKEMFPSPVGVRPLTLLGSFRHFKNGWKPFPSPVGVRPLTLRELTEDQVPAESFRPLLG